MIEVNTKIEDSDIYIVEVIGEVDASSSIHLENSLEESLNNSKKVLVDLHGLEYISSAGLGVFISIVNRVQVEEIKFILFGIKPNVLDIFEILGLDTLFIIVKDKKEALVGVK